MTKPQFVGVKEQPRLSANKEERAKNNSFDRKINIPPLVNVKGSDFGLYWAYVVPPPPAETLRSPATV